jgi:hypothetical protein
MAKKIGEKSLLTGSSKYRGAPLSTKYWITYTLLPLIARYNGPIPLFDVYIKSAPLVARRLTISRLPFNAAIPIAVIPLFLAWSNGNLILMRSRMTPMFPLLVAICKALDPF